MTEPAGDISASGILKAQQINEAIDRILSASTTADDPNHTSISETDLLKLSQFLRASEKPKWAERPRIYAILHLIGEPEVIEDFVKENIFDISLPFRENCLPFALKSPSARKAFIQLQNRVLTSAADIEKKPGTHQSLRNGDLYYQTKADLGNGSFGWVDQVWSTLSLEFFARKRILRRATFKKDHEAITAFIDELKVLQKVSHHHLVEFVGSYTDSKHVAFLMRPVAKTDLREYLRITPFPQENHHQLRKFFGCLAVGVRYLHRQNIRHKDIKPPNILISYTGHILITDFGTALDWTENGRSTTQGSKLVGLTPEYCAPEVFSYENRNTLSDIYSLGCVYFEMLTLLKGETIQSLHQFFSDNGMKLMAIRTNLTVANTWLDQLLLKQGNDYDNTPVTWIRRMIEKHPDRRPGSEELAQWTIGTDNASRFCCPSCMDEDEVQSHDDPLSSDVDESSPSPEISEIESPSQELEPDMNQNSIPDDVGGTVGPDAATPASSNQELPSNLPSEKSNPKQQQQDTPKPSSPSISSSNIQRSPQNTLGHATPGLQPSQKAQPDPQLMDKKDGLHNGYFISADRKLTTAMIADLKADSARWEAERRASPLSRDYRASTAHQARQYYGPTEAGSRETYYSTQAPQTSSTQYNSSSDTYYDRGYGDPPANSAYDSSAYPDPATYTFPAPIPSSTIATTPFSRGDRDRDERDKRSDRRRR